MSATPLFTTARRKRHRRKAWGAALLVLVLGVAFGVAACGGDDSAAPPPADDPAPPPAAEEPAPADEPAPPPADPPAEPEPPAEEDPGLTGQRQLVVLQDSIAPGLDLDGANVVHDGVHDILESTMEALIEYPATLEGGILLPNYKVEWDEFEPAAGRAELCRQRVHGR